MASPAWCTISCVLIHMVVENFETVTSFFDYPLPSSALNIYQVSSPTGLYELLNVDDVLFKCVRLPVNDKSCVILPLLHSS